MAASESMARPATVGRIRSRGLWLVLLSMLCFPTFGYAEGLLDDVKAALADSDWQVRLSALEKLADRKDHATIDLLISIAEDRSEYWKVQIKAIQLLGEAADARSIAFLTYILNSNTGDWRCPAVHSSVAAALGNFRNDRRAFEALVNGLQNEELITREAAVLALGNVGNAGAIPHLLPLLRDMNLAIRLGTVQALAMIGDQGVIPSLREVAESDSDETARGEAKRALTHIIHALQRSQ